MAAAAAIKAPPSNSHASGKQDSTLFITDDGPEGVKATFATDGHPLSPAPQGTTNASSTTQTRSVRPPPADFLSDKATVALVRRILCAQHLPDRGRAAPAPLEELLPPLTSRNDVDLQLYALISIILRESVQNWYSKITPDETFVAEIVQIIAHCTRALEQRLRKVDLAGLLLDELPELLDAHVRAYRIAKDASAARPPLQSSLREVYHSIWPLPALSPVPDPAKGADADKQAENELAYRQLLVQGVLALILPTEDLQNECLDAIVGQILSELIVNNLMIDKLSQPWLLYEIFIIVSRVAHKRESTNQQENPKQHGNKIVVPRDTRPTGTLAQFFWSIVQGVFLLVSAVRILFNTVKLTLSLPPRFSPTSHSIKSTTRANGKPYTPSISSEMHMSTSDTPVASLAIWPCVGNLLEIHARMPWLEGALSILQWGGLCGPGKIADIDGFLDRLLSHWIQTYMLSPALLPPLLRSVRGALFPNNAPGTSTLTAPSSDNELAALRRRCARAIWAVIPTRVGRLYYGANVWAWQVPSASSPLGKNESNTNGDEQRSGPLDSTNSSAAEGAGGGEDTASPNCPGGGSSLDDQHQQHDSAHAGVHVTQEGASQQRQRQASRRRQRQQQKQGELSIDGNFLQPPQQTGTTANKKLRTHDGTRLAMAHDEKSFSTNEKVEDDEDERILVEIETGILDVFSDPFCNKHLLYGILELVIVRLMPELMDRGVVDLLEERLV